MRLPCTRLSMKPLWHLPCESKTLCYPRAAVFAFCVALMAWNGMSVIHAALRSVHGEERVEENLSGVLSVAGNIAGLSRDDDCDSCTGMGGLPESYDGSTGIAAQATGERRVAGIFSEAGPRSKETAASTKLLRQPKTLRHRRVTRKKKCLKNVTFTALPQSPRYRSIRLTRCRKSIYCQCLGH